MTKPSLLILAVTISSFCFSQTSTDKLDSVEYLLTTGDTTRAIEKLDEFTSTYPTNILTFAAYALLVELYIKTGEFKKAHQQALNLLEFDARNLDFRNIVSKTPYLFLTNRIYYPETKAVTCINLSEMFMKLNERDSSLKYLNLADDKFLPYKNCGNGILMYKSFLSLKFCDHYLRFGDTSNAIKRLLQFFTVPDGDALKVTRRLKSVLLTKYTQEQIRDEVGTSIKKCKIRRASYWGDDAIQFKLFGETLYVYYNKRMSAKKQLRENRFLSLLTS